MTTTEQEASTKPKKKERAPPPPAPPAIATACLLVRYAINSLLAPDHNDSNDNDNNNDAKHVESAPFQTMFLKEKPRLTGKMLLTASKAVAAQTLLLDDKAASGLSLPLEESDLFVGGVQPLLQRVLSSDAYTVRHIVTTKQDLLSSEQAADAQDADELYARWLDETHYGKKSKTKPTDPLTLAILYHQDQPLYACVVPGVPYANPSHALESISLETAQVSAGKKKGQVQFSIYWEAHLSSSKDDATLAPAVATLPVTRLDLAPEAQALMKRVQQAQQELQKQQREASQNEAEKLEAPTAAKEMKVDPFNVEGKIDYDKLVQQFGSTLIEPDLMQRLEALTVGRGRVPRLHRFLRRGIFFSHRDLHHVVHSLEQEKAPLYLYTGRGPSSAAMHLGHLVPFLFTQWLQQALDCPLVIQMTDDEKFIFKGEYDEHTGDNLDYFANLTVENARDIIACGFDYEKTFLFSDLDYVGTMYPNICRIWKSVTTNTVNSMFGFTGSSNMGKVAFPAIQAAPSFASSFPTVLNVPPEERRSTKQICLIPCAIDQDPYFRMTRDVAHKLVDKNVHPLGGKPALIHSKFFPPLQGAEGKMSSSNTNSAIFLTDTADEIAHKIRSFCFSGGRETGAKQKKHGADIEIDVAYQWLRFFLEDDEELEQIGKDYSTGSGEYWATGQVKNRLIAVLQELVAQHQERRAKITDEEVHKWMAERCILTKK